MRLACVSGKLKPNSINSCWLKVLKVNPIMTQKIMYHLDKENLYGRGS